MQKTFGILLVVFFLQLPALNICNGEPPKPLGKPSQKPQFITSDEASAIAKHEVDESLAKLKETYDKHLLKIADQKLQVSEGYLKIAQSILSAIAWVAGVIGVLIALFGFLGIKSLGEWFKNFKDTIGKEVKEVREAGTKEIEGVKKSLENEIQVTLAKANTSLEKCEQSMQDILIGRANFLGREAFLQWELARIAPEDQKKRLIGFAITDSEAALKLNPPDEKLLTKIKSNLSYYYAEVGDQTKKNMALEYASEARERAEKWKEISWLANYGYVAMRYATTSEEVDRVIVYLLSLKTQYPSLSEEADRYLKEAYEKKGKVGGSGGVG